MLNPTEIEALFKTAQNQIKNYEESRKTVDSVYDIANAFWKCYDMIRSDGTKFTDQNWKLAIDTITQAKGQIGEKSIKFSLIPEHFLETIHEKKAASKKDKNALEEADDSALCYELVKEELLDKKFLSRFVQKIYLTLILTILNNLAGNDIFLLINKCLVFDHLGNQAYSHKEFSNILEKSTKKVLANTFDSRKKLDIYYYLGMLNYRLNYYGSALILLRKYAEGLISEKTFAEIDANTKKELSRIYVNLAYCMEKINDEDSIGNAIKLLESVKENKEIDVFNKGSYVSPIFGKTPDSPNGQCLFSFASCDEDVQIEIHHALAHFYNEQAVFHSSSVKDKAKIREWIKKSREYISKAKNDDSEHSFHSCHGMICFEDDDFKRAYEIYEETRLNGDVNKNTSLYYELVFYLAQSISVLDDLENASSYWEEFEAYCHREKDDDALAQYHIVKTKTALSASSLYKLTLDEFRVMLENLTHHKLSKYVPKSMADERVRLILTLNTFYALRNMIDGELSWVDGIEEVFYNLNIYWGHIRDRKLPYNNINFEQNWLVSTKHIKNDETTRELRKVSEDEIFIIEYKELKIACFGDYRKIINADFKFSYRGRIKRGHESQIIEQIINNKHVDVLLFAPTSSLQNSTARKRLLKDIVGSGVCVVALCENLALIKKLLNEVNRGGKGNSPFYCTTDENAALQMAVCLSVYELMRKSLITPTPMLGLAPLVESKSYSFQAGELISELLLPPKLDAVDKTQRNTLVNLVKRLDEIQLSTYKANKHPIESPKAVFEEYIKRLAGDGSEASFEEHINWLADDSSYISFAAYFDEASTDDESLYVIPYILFDDELKSKVKYICPGSRKRKYNLISIYKATQGYDNVQAFIDDAKTKGDFCNEMRCKKRWCKACCVNLKDSISEGNKQLEELLQNLFSIEKIENNVICICTSVEHHNSKGVLFLITKCSDIKDERLYEICETIHEHRKTPLHNFPKAPKAPQLPPNLTSDSPNGPEATMESIICPSHSIVWINLENLKSELTKIRDSLLTETRSARTTSEAKSDAQAKADNAREIISDIDKTLAKKVASTPSVERIFVDGLKEVQKATYLTDDARSYTNEIISSLESMMGVKKNG